MAGLLERGCRPPGQCTCSSARCAASRLQLGACFRPPAPSPLHRVQELMQHKLVFIETQDVVSAPLGRRRAQVAAWGLSAAVPLSPRHAPCPACQPPSGDDPATTAHHSPPSVFPAQVETTLALDNFRRACDCGRGAVFFRWGHSGGPGVLGAASYVTDVTRPPTNPTCPPTPPARCGPVAAWR